MMPRMRGDECRLFGAKRTCLFAPHMSAFDPKRLLWEHGLDGDLCGISGKYTALLRLRR